MNIVIQGNSGCKIDIVQANDKLFVHKSTEDEKYVNRLLTQAEKQDTMDSYITEAKISNIRIPQIHKIDIQETSLTIKMDYIYSNNFIEFFERANISDINNFIKTIIEFTDFEISKSQLQKVNKSVFLDKVISVYNNSKNNKYYNSNLDILFENIKSYINKFDDIEIPIGMCHGDLTFSNILFTNDDIYLIDFLDSFIETPLQDIVKLRQDTKYLWSINMYSKRYDKTRLVMITNYIDNIIDNHFKSYKWYCNYYKLIQLINLSRIIPYAKTQEVMSYLITNINNLLNE